MSEEIKAAREGVGAVVELIKAAGDGPKAREAASNIGDAAITVTRALNTILLPLAAVNFAFERARRYFSEDFQRDLLERTKYIPAENVIEPKASIAGPALQGIAFAQDEPNLKEMYLSLIATSMDNRMSKNTHPAFVEIIKQLEGDEARLLGQILAQTGSLSIVQVRVADIGAQGYRQLENHLMDLRNSETMECIENDQQAAMIDNWIRLGLVEVSYGQFLVSEGSYSWVEERPEFQRVKSQHSSDKSVVSFQRGCIGRTALGAKFALAVGLLNGSSNLVAG